jgi:hypothetical protein
MEEMTEGQTMISVPSDAIETQCSNIALDEEEDPLWARLRREALEVEAAEPELSMLLHRTVLAPSVNSFDDAIVSTLSYRLVGATSSDPTEQSRSSSVVPSFCPVSLKASEFSVEDITTAAGDP